MMRFRFLAVTVIFSVAWGVHAQQPGTPQYNTVLLPAHGAGDTVRQGFEDRWGAFAMSVSNGMTGFELGASSQVDAESAALRKCAESGGLSCEIKLSFYNQCGAVAYGAGISNFTHAPTLRAARRISVKECGSSECKVFWSGCSFAQRIR